MALSIALISIQASASAAIDDLAWLEGCWQNDDGSEKEVWVKDSDDSLIGFAVTLNGKQIAFYELLSIKDLNGELAYTAHPEGQPATTFRLDSIAPLSVEFINAQHDYPQRIHYRSRDEQLMASISLLNGERETLFSKATCTDQPA